MWVVFGLVMIGMPHGAMGCLVSGHEGHAPAIVIGTIFVVLWTFALVWMGHMTKPSSRTSPCRITPSPPWP